MTDETPKPESTPGEESFWEESDASRGQGREWLGQLQQMIEQLATQAGPVVRQVGAKAAELAALAGEKAGPVAHRAAELTSEAGVKLAERSRDFAAEIRRDQIARGERRPEGEAAPGATAPSTTEDSSSRGDEESPTDQPTSTGVG